MEYATHCHTHINLKWHVHTHTVRTPKGAISTLLFSAETQYTSMRQCLWSDVLLTLSLQKATGLQCAQF